MLARLDWLTIPIPFITPDEKRGGSSNDNNNNNNDDSNNMEGQRKNFPNKKNTNWQTPIVSGCIYLNREYLKGAREGLCILGDSTSGLFLFS